METQTGVLYKSKMVHNATKWHTSNNLSKLNSKTTVEVRQRCPLSPVLLNIFLEKIMQKTLTPHCHHVSIGGRPLYNPQFADDIDLLEGNEEELTATTHRKAVENNLLLVVAWKSAPTKAFSSTTSSHGHPTIWG